MKNVQLIIISILLAGMGGPASASDLCTPSAIHALKTQYNHVSSATISDVLYESSCTSQSDDDSSGFGIGIPDIVDLSFSSNGKTVRDACYERDRNFFSKHANKLIVSALPDSVAQQIARCFGGLSLKVTQRDDTVSFNVMYSPKENGTLAKVVGFNWSPKEALSCSEMPLRKGTEIIPGGIAFSCTKTQNSAVAVNLNTTQASETVWLHRIPEIKETRFNWEYEVKGGPDSGWTTCKNQFGDVGGAVNCKGDNTCGHKTPIIGLCQVRHGAGLVSIDQEQFQIEDKWSYKVEGGPDSGWTTCYHNGKKIGTPHDCRSDGSCDNANSILGWCAGRYSSQ